MDKDNGGPAFPAPDDFKRDSGMTMRDYFAAKALQGHLATLPIDFVAKKLNDKALAGWAYAIADAMLAARKE